MRPRTYSSNAERQKAYRNRKRNASRDELRSPADPAGDRNGHRRRPKDENIFPDVPLPPAGTLKRDQILAGRRRLFARGLEVLSNDAGDPAQIEYRKVTSNGDAGDVDQVAID